MNIAGRQCGCAAQWAHSIFLTPLALATMAEMANVAVFQVGGTYYSAQGEIHINNKDSGMHSGNFRSVQMSLIDGPLAMKDLIF